MTIESLLTVLAIILGLLQLADITSTLAFLRNRTGYEANPIVRWLMARCRRLPGLLIAKGAAAAGIWLLWASPLAPVALPAACLCYAWIVWKNVKIARGQ